MWRSPSPRLAVCLPPIFIDAKIFFFVMLFRVCVEGCQGRGFGVVCLPATFIAPNIFFCVMLFWVCVWEVGFRVWFGVWGLGLEGSGLGFRGLGAGCSVVWASGCRVLDNHRVDHHTSHTQHSTRQRGVTSPIRKRPSP